MISLRSRGAPPVDLDSKLLHLADQACSRAATSSAIRENTRARRPTRRRGPRPPSCELCFEAAASTAAAASGGGDLPKVLVLESVRRLRARPAVDAGAQQHRSKGFGR